AITDGSVSEVCCMPAGQPIDIPNPTGCLTSTSNSIQIGVLDPPYPTSVYYLYWVINGAKLLAFRSQDLGYTRADGIVRFVNLNLLFNQIHSLPNGTYELIANDSPRYDIPPTFFNDIG